MKTTTQPTTNFTKTFSFKEESFKCAIHNENILYYCLCKEKLCSRCIQDGLHLRQHSLQQKDVRIIPTKELKQVYMSEEDDLEEIFNQLSEGKFSKNELDTNSGIKFNPNDLVNELPELKYLSEKFNFFINQIYQKFFNNFFSQDGEEMKKIYSHISDLNGNGKNKILGSNEIIDEINRMVLMKERGKEILMRNSERIASLENEFLNKNEEFECEFKKLLEKFFKKSLEINLEADEEIDRDFHQNLHNDRVEKKRKRKNNFNRNLEESNDEEHISGHSLYDQINSNLKKLFIDEYNDYEENIDNGLKLKNYDINYTITNNNLPQRALGRKKLPESIKKIDFEKNNTSNNMSISYSDVIIFLKSNNSHKKSNVKNSGKNTNKNSGKKSIKNSNLKSSIKSRVKNDFNNLNINLKVISSSKNSSKFYSNSNSNSNMNMSKNINKKLQSFSLWKDEIMGKLSCSDSSSSSSKTGLNSNSEGIEEENINNNEKNYYNYTIQDCSLSYEKTIFDNFNQTQKSHLQKTTGIKAENRKKIISNNLNKNKDKNKNDLLEISYDKNKLIVDVNELFHNEDNRNRINKIVRKNRGGRIEVIRENRLRGNNFKIRERDRVREKERGYKNHFNNNNNNNYSNYNQFEQNSNTPMNYNSKTSNNYKEKVSKNFHGKFQDDFDTNDKYDSIPNNTNSYYDYECAGVHRRRQVDYKAGKMNLICLSCKNSFVVPVALAKQRKTCYYCFKAATNGNNNI